MNSGRSYRHVAACLAAAVCLATLGCGTFRAHNASLAHYDPAYGYRTKNVYEKRPSGDILFLLAFTASMPVAAIDVFHWVDENGVPNFSQQAPGAGTSGVSQLTLDGMAPPGYDPEEDRYNVQAQQERMQALREEMAARREASADRQRYQPQQTAQYRNIGYSNSLFWNRPYYPKPPIEPQPPIAQPDPTVPFRPLGSNN